jgi:hypothetical protein
LAHFRQKNSTTKHNFEGSPQIIPSLRLGSLWRKFSSRADLTLFFPRPVAIQIGDAGGKFIKIKLNGGATRKRRQADKKHGRRIFAVKSCAAPFHF